MSFFKNYLYNLNLFESSSDTNDRQDEQQQQQQQRRRFNTTATRVYIVVLTFLLIYLGFFIWSDLEIINVIQHYPNEQQVDDLPNDAVCPCSRISLSYGEFISLEPILHQVCSSHFVSDRWIEAIFSGSNFTYFNLKDFRNFGSAQFQALAGLCNLSYSNLKQSIDSFKQSTFINSKMLPETTFQKEIQSAIDRFQQIVPRAFGTQLELIRQVTTSNRLVSGLQTNYIITYFSTFNQITAATYDNSDKTSCNCLLNDQCASDAVFNSIFGAPTRYHSSSIKPLLGISSGCLPVNSILSSTLACFYDQMCVDNLISFFPTNERFSAMTDDKKSRFGPYATVQSIVDKLMVEDWIIDISYQKYSESCAPLSCTYSHEKRHSVAHVLIQLIGLLSGLILVLRLVIPGIVRFIIDKLNNIQYPKVPFRIRLRQIKANGKKLIIELNTFEHFPCNDRQIRYQRYATRLRIFLIVISITIIAGYNLMIKSVHHRIVTNSTELEYLNLEKTYTTGLNCSCTSISIPYVSFMTIQPHEHQICSSYLITPQWIDYSNSESGIDVYILDYRYQASNQFQTLAMLCEQARTTINDSLNAFLQSQVVNSQIIRREIFQTKMIQLIKSWKAATISQFRQRIELIRITTYANQLMNRMNIYFQSNYSGGKIITEPRLYGDCNCAFNRTCHESMKIHDASAIDYTTVLFTVPNFFVGCYPIEALFLSTLECFYNQSCMKSLHSNFHSSLDESWSFPALNSNLSSSNEIIETMVNQLMVVEWLENVNFSSYYRKCAPRSCIIEYNARYSPMKIINIVIGILGGLSLGLQMLIWLALRIFEKSIEGFSFRASLQSLKELFDFNDEDKLTHRLQIILVIMMLYAFYVHHAFRSELITKEIKKPSRAVYEDLIRQYPDSLHCSCSEITIQYRSFLNVTASFHPICSRDFVSEAWNIVHSNPLVFLLGIKRNYAYAGIAQLQAMMSLCKLSQDTIHDSLDQLLTSYLVNNQLLSSSLLREHIQRIIDDFKIQVPKTVMNMFALIRMTTIANKLMTTYSTNWIFAFPPIRISGYTLHTVPVVESGCNCGLTSKCMMNYFGLQIGCYVIETISQSLLECLYDTHCIDKTNTSRPLNNSADPSRFPINSTFGSLLNELMLEKLSDNHSYDDYFRHCAPSFCVWSHFNQRDLTKGITTLISLYGGVVIIGKLVAIIIVKLLPRQSVQVTPTTN
ncbi:hypothetical protein I4U23_016885 [Adineta vaga]|nr:hypothetical protein I4U23_016885 [Adineta vaga]